MIENYEKTMLKTEKNEEPALDNPSVFGIIEDQIANFEKTLLDPQQPESSKSNARKTLINEIQNVFTKNSNSNVNSQNGVVPFATGLMLG
jgi:hypothetical protein